MVGLLVTSIVALGGHSIDTDQPKDVTDEKRMSGRPTDD